MRFLTRRPVRWLLPVAALQFQVASAALAQAGRTAAPAIDPGLLGALEWREIGPAIMGGRVADLAVVESNPAIFYVATATGGLWRTTNHGTSWEPLFDDQPTSSLGDVTLAPSNPNIIWVGTGEPQNRQSSPWGNGVYRSVDGGKTWTHLGLADTRHIARIVVHPENPDIAYVAAVGHLWGPNAERGVFKTTDGGKTWAKVLYLDEHTGAIDLAMDPGDPNTVYAAMYQRRRTTFGFNGGSQRSGLYRTLDGGATWKELTNGLPAGQKGRIGIDIYRRDGNIVYALVEADRQGGFGQQQEQSERPRRSGLYRSLDRGETWEQRGTTNNRPMYYSQVRVDPNDYNRIYQGGANLYSSDDGGKTYNDDAASEVHSDHHALWIDPANSNHLIMGSDGGVSVSFDRSKTWRMYDNLSLAQFYEIGLDMRDPYMVCGGLQDNGSWCGPSATRSARGILNPDWVNVGSGDGFFVRIDPNDPTIVFAESQNGNVNRVDLNTMERQSIRPLNRRDPPQPPEGQPGPPGQQNQYRWNWNTPIHISAHDPATIYAGGNYLLKSTDRGRTWREISPDLTKQIDRDKLEIMGVLPSDSMLSRHDGISTYGNLTTIGESPTNAQLIYVGTDDGNLQVTRDGGATWTDLTANVRGLPPRTYVTRVVASRFEEGTVFATFDGHYNDDYKPYVYASQDYGRTWRPIVAGLPDGWSVNVIIEHPRARNLLFVGNEIGAYASFDRGERWTRLPNLPVVPVDDIKIHPRDHDLVLGTHGRGMWILDDMTPLEHLSSEVLARAAHVFPVRQATLFNPYTPQGWLPGAYSARNPPYGALIRYYLQDDVAAPVAAGSGNGERGRGNGTAEDEPTVKLTVLDAAGRTVRTLEGLGKAGIQQVAWDLRYDPPFEQEPGQGGGGGGGFGGGPPRGPRVLPGTYRVRLDAGGGSSTAEIPVRMDPRVTIAAADLEARQQLLMRMYQLAGPVHQASRAAQRLNQQMTQTQRLLNESRSAPESLKTQARTIADDLRRLGQRLNQQRGTVLQVFGGAESATARPTDDMEWRAGRAEAEAPPLIAELNQFIETKLPALNFGS